MSAAALGALVGAATCLLASPYLAAIATTAHDRRDPAWWRGASTPSRYTRVGAALTALWVGALAGSAAGWSAVLPAFVLLALAAVPLIVIDIDLHRLPDRLVGVAAAGGAVLLAAAAAERGTWAALLRAGEGAAAVGVALLVLNLISPRSFGFGDVKLGAVLGGYLGWFGWPDVFYGIFAGFVLGAMVSVLLLVLRRATMKDAVAFGPSLILGALLVLAFDLAPG